MPNETDPRIKHLLQDEAKKRAQYTTKLSDSLLSHSFEGQKTFIVDPAKRKAALCTRRSGKTWGTAIMLLDTALQFPASTCVFLSYTRVKAKDTMSRPLEHFMRLANVNFTFNTTEGKYTLENQSRIILRGADKPDEIEKLRGEGYPLAVIDECGHGNYADKLDYIVDEILEPCVAEYDGSIVLIGTPSPFIETLFYNVTGPTPTETGWSVHNWNWQHNTSSKKKGIRVCDEIKKTIDARLARDKTYIHSDGYRREWCAEWVMDPEKLCYRFSRDYLIQRLPCKLCKNTSENPCKDHPHTVAWDEYFYILGSDMGYEDDTSFVVLAYHPNDPTLYIVESFKDTKLDFFQVCSHVTNNLHSRYKFVQYVIDGSGKQGVETMKNRFQIPWKSTNKAPNYKHDAIRQMASDFASSAIKIVEPANLKLIEEYKKLVWDPKHPAKEKSSCKNHATDAALYAFLESRHWMSKVPDPQEQERPFNPYLETIPSNDFVNVFDMMDLNDQLENK